MTTVLGRWAALAEVSALWVLIRKPRLLAARYRCNIRYVKCTCSYCWLHFAANSDYWWTRYIIAYDFLYTVDIFSVSYFNTYLSPYAVQDKRISDASVIDWQAGPKRLRNSQVRTIQKKSLVSYVHDFFHKFTNKHVCLQWWWWWWWWWWWLW